MFTIIISAILAIGCAVAASIFLGSKDKFNFIAGGAAFAVILIGGIAFSSFAAVSQSHIGIVTTFGQVQSDVLAEGAHFINPASKIHEVFIGLDVAKVQNAQAASKDLQTVHTDLVANYRVDPPKARALYEKDPSLNYLDNYVGPAMYEVFKAVVARYTAEELVTKRQEVSDGIMAALRTKLSQYGLLVQDINITNFKFSKSFDDAIEAKVTASQNAEKAERDLRRVKYEAEQKVAQARGEADAIQIQAQAIKTSGGEEYLRLQAINRWDGKLPTYMGGGAPLPFVNVAK